MKYQPEIFNAMLKASPSPEKAFNAMFAEWGRNKELDARALAMWTRYQNQSYAGGRYGKRIDPLFQQDETATPTPIEFVDLGQYLEILQRGQYVYWRVGGIEVANLAQVDLDDPNLDPNVRNYARAYQTLVDFLDPSKFQGPNQELAWWHEDNRVTVDEIVAVIAFHEGKNELSVRQAVYNRFILYMGGDARYGFDMSQDEIAGDEKLQNTNLDRLLRFLTYYEPWDLPTSTIRQSGIEFNFDMTPDRVVYADGRSALTPVPTATPRPGALRAADVVRDEVRQFFTDPNSVLPSSQPLQDLDVDDPGWDFAVLADLPFHFATRSVGGLRSGEAPTTVWPQTIVGIIESGSKGTGRNQVYDIIPQGVDQYGREQYTVVFTPNQAVSLCGSGDRGVTLGC